MSICNLDDTHTKSKKGGAKVAYQGRKKAKTTNNLLLVDSTGVPVAFSKPIAGNHHDIFDIKKHFNFMMNQLHKTGINTEGLFMNADAGFDNKVLIKECEKLGIILNNPQNKRKNKDFQEEYRALDEEMYKNRYVVERTNACMDSERNLLIRQDTSQESWNTLFAIQIWIRKIQKNT